MHRFIVISALLASFSASCSGDGIIVVSGSETVSAHVEATVAGPLTGFAALDRHRVIVSQDNTVTAIDLFATSEILADGEGDVDVAAVRDAVAWSDDRLLILTADSMVVWEGVVRPSPIAEIVDVPTVHHLVVSRGGDDLWLATDQGLLLWHDGWLHAIDVGGPAAAPFAVDPRVPGQPVVWATGPDGLVALVPTGGASWTAREVYGSEPPDRVAVDRAGDVWLAAGGSVHRRGSDGAWQVYRFPDPVRDVAGNPAADAVWIATDREVYVASPRASGDTSGGAPGESREIAFVRVTGVPDSAWPAGSGAPTAPTVDVDDAGRLLARDGDGLWQISVDRPIAVAGLPPDGLIYAATQVLIAPTDPAAVADITARLGERSLELTAGTDEQPDSTSVWRVVVEPNDVPAGAHDLVIDVRYGDDSAASRWPLIVSDPTWTGDIEPLYVERCALCHGGDTGSVVLDNPEAWELRFADIVDRLTRNNMPLGREPLTEVEKATVKAWGAKGFPR